MPGAVRGGVRAVHQPGPGHHRVHREGDKRQGLGRRMDQAGAAPEPDGKERRSSGIRAGGTRRRTAAKPLRAHGDRVRARRVHRRASAPGDPGLQARQGIDRAPRRADGGGGRPVQDGRACREGLPSLQAGGRVRRCATYRRLHPAQGPSSSGARVERRPLRHGVPDAAEQAPERAERGPRRADHSGGQARGDPWRRGHGGGLPRHGAPAGRRGCVPVRAAVRASGYAPSRQPLAAVAHDTAVLGCARGGRDPGTTTY